MKQAAPLPPLCWEVLQEIADGHGFTPGFTWFSPFVLVLTVVTRSEILWRTV